VYQEFDGGPGQVALHGLDNIGGDLGTAESHGCVRLADSSIRWLVYRVGPGDPVTITN
jgi:lipoprotein-anchoring transpeptidase ErfK/SrfK